MVLNIASLNMIYLYSSLQGADYNKEVIAKISMNDQILICLNQQDEKKVSQYALWWSNRLTSEISISHC